MEGTGSAASVDRVREGLRLFNEERFFEAHEALEDIWHQERGEPRLFLQGLIQICAGFHHFQNGNLSGAATLLQRGANKMRGYPPRYLGLDVRGILTAVDASHDRIEGLRAATGVPDSLQFPKIDLD